MEIKKGETFRRGYMQGYKEAREKLIQEIKEIPLKEYADENYNLTQRVRFAIINELKKTEV